MSPADRRIWERHVEVQRQAGRRRRRWLMAATAVTALLAGGLAALHSPLFAATSVTIQGGAGIARAEVLDISGLQRRPPLIDVDTTVMERRIEQIPRVASAVVMLHWPTGVQIVLTERQPVAVAPLPGGRGGFAVLDSSGRVLSTSLSRPAGLPEVVGVGPVGIPGTSLHEQAGELLTAAASLTAELVPQVDEVGRDQAGDLVLALASGPIALLGDDSALQQKLISLVTLLQKADLHGIATIDLRAPGSPVLTPLGAGPTLRVDPGG